VGYVNLRVLFIMQCRGTLQL